MTTAETSAPAAPVAPSALSAEPAAAPAAFEPGSSLLTTPEAPAETKDPVEPGEEPAKEEDKPEEPAPKAPEKYEFKLAEGVALNETAVAAFEPVARELDLSQEQADKLVEIYAQQEAARVQQWTETVKGWTEAAKADPEFGGPKMPENMGVAVRALKEYGSPELNELLDSFGIGNHPAFIRFAYRAGKALGEDKLVPANSGGSKSAAELLYGNTDYGRNK
jgi:hypothetical protein